MAESTDKVIRQLRQVLGLEDGGLADAELLGRYVQQRDAEAFEALVRRHGSLVWGVCHRLLGSTTTPTTRFKRPSSFSPARRPRFGRAIRSAVGCTAWPAKSRDNRKRSPWPVAVENAVVKQWKGNVQ